MKAFGPFRLDTVNHCLWRANERAALTPKAFDVLRYLVEHADRLVTQNELLEALWPETYVNPEGIRKYILEIRKVLEDHPSHPEFIETLPKRGYQFVARITDHRATASPATVLDPSPQPSGDLVGRQAGLARLHESARKALAGQRQIAFVTGEAGIGKTTLVDAFQRQTTHCPNLRIARGQCIEGFGGKEAYYPVLEALGSLLQDAEDSALVPTLAKLAPTWLIQFPALVRPEQRESLQREILGSTRQRMVRELCEAIEIITAQTPLIVILEDLHWVDHSTLDLISAVGRRREPARLLLIATYRPVDLILSQSPLKALKQDLLVHGLCQEIAIEHLEEPDIAEYLTKVFSVPTLPPGLSRMIHENSGGNPLFMVAIVQDMLDKRLIAEDDGRLILTAAPRDVYPGIPETLQQMLEIQLEQLSPEEQRYLESASVAGEVFSVWAVAAMLRNSPAPIEEACARLANRRHFIRAVGVHDAPNGTPSAHYEFRHSLYRQVLYRRLTSSQRGRFHQTLASLLLPVCEAGKRELAAELAMRFEEGGDYEQAAHCLILAAENVAARFSPRDSVQTLEHALELCSTVATPAGKELEIQIHQRLGDLHFALGEMSESAVSYEAAADRAKRAGLDKAHIVALVRLAFPAWYLSNQRGNEVCRQALEASAGLDDLPLGAQTRLALSSFRLLYDRWRDEDARICASAKETLGRLSGSGIVCDVFYMYVQAFLGDYREGLRQADSVIASTNNPTAYVLASGARALICLLSGRFGEALGIVRAGMEAAGKNGDDPWIYIIIETWLRALCFDYEGVRRLSVIKLRSDAEQHSVQPRTIALLAAGYSELLRGGHDEALNFFARIRGSLTPPSFFLHWYWRMQAQLGAAEVCLSAGALGNARSEADGFYRSAFSTEEPNMRALACELRSRVACAENDRNSAREYMNSALEITGRFDVPFAAWRVHAAAAHLCLQEANRERAIFHGARARDMIMRVADSFEKGEPLRESLLSAPQVRRLFERNAFGVNPVTIAAGR